MKNEHLIRTQLYKTTNRLNRVISLKRLELHSFLLKLQL